MTSVSDELDALNLEKRKVMDNIIEKYPDLSL